MSEVSLWAEWSAWLEQLDSLQPGTKDSLRILH